MGRIFIHDLEIIFILIDLKYCSDLFQMKVLFFDFDFYAMASIDDDLARATSQRLSMGSSVVEDCKNVSYTLPNKLHPSLYNNSLGDVSMMSNNKNNNNNNNNNSNNKGNEKREHSHHKLTVDVGVPGFPDFPDCWQGISSAAAIQSKVVDTAMHHADKKHSKKCTKTKRQIKRQQQRQIVRKAVNTSGIPKSNQGKVIKNILRNERRLRRIEKVVRLQERRRRKRDMGALCKGMASVTC